MVQHHNAVDIERSMKTRLVKVDVEVIKMKPKIFTNKRNPLLRAVLPFTHQHSLLKVNWWELIRLWEKIAFLYAKMKIMIRYK